MIRAALLVLALAAPAAAFELAAPLACAGGACFIQQYVDRDPGPGARDFAGGGLSYDDHRGTDFALPSLAAMAQGVAVTAAAPGTVAAVRDGMDDIAADTPGAPDLAGRDCGNGVLIDHEDGWQTQYCHLRRGSVAVAAGAAVARGDTLGLVGLSGRTAFPHVHLTLRCAGATVDPFAPDAAAAPCGGGAAPLWADPPAYRPGGIVAAGFADAVPGFDAIKSGLPAAPPLGRGAPALVVWAHLFGGRTGDVVRISIAGPDGIAFTHADTLERDQARLFRAAGTRPPAGGWPAGTYEGRAALERDGRVIERGAVTLDLR